MPILLRYLKDLSITRKIHVSILLPCLGALVVAGCGIFAVHLVSFRSEFIDELNSIGRVAAQFMSPAIEFHDNNFARQNLAILRSRPYVLSALVVDASGEDFATYHSPGAPTGFTFPRLDGPCFKDGKLIVGLPVETAGQRAATLFLVGDYRGAYRKSISLYAGVLVLVLLVCVLLSLFLSIWLQRLISAPILNLASTARDVAARNDYSLRAPRFSRDEVGALTDAFNGMLARIQEQDRALTLSQEKIESIVNSIDGIVFECTPQWAHTFVSRQSERLLGFTPEQWLANPHFWLDHVHHEDRGRVKAACEQALASRQSYYFEYRMLSADGGTVWFREGGVILGGDDAPVAVRGILIDISAEKAAQEREKLSQTLILNSRQAGMAEVATGVLHNVGNVLNSVNVSATVLHGFAERSKVGQVRKLANLVAEHGANFASFLTTDSRGKRVPEFISHLAAALEEERDRTLLEANSLIKNIEHITSVIAMQQSYAKAAGILEDVAPTLLVEDALHMTADILRRHHLAVVRDFETVPSVRVDRHKVLQILVNLIRNAKDAMTHRQNKRLEITIRADTGQVRVSVADNGVGIAPEDLTRIFGHGFTTKANGHGFGLHIGALAAREMGGSLQVESAGPGLGATFSLRLPVAQLPATSIKS